MPSILDEIIGHKRQEIEAAKQVISAQDLEGRLATAPPVRDFVAALLKAGPIALIAEVKKASPSAGLIRKDFDPASIATSYQKAGAACISCLTDERFFQGRLQDLCAVRNAVPIPVLRKDFVLEPYQILESRVAGADCVLLIAECLDDANLRKLYDTASQLDMHCLIEVHESQNLDRVLELEPALVGINNRNLKTFQTDLQHSIRLADRIRKACLTVSESGIFKPARRASVATGWHSGHFGR